MNADNVKFRVRLGVCGGIAAYKAIEVMRLLQKRGCEVEVAMTAHATEFIRPLTFRALTDKYVLVDDYAENNPDPIAHINFSQTADLLLIVPATANILAKFAGGIADDFLSSTYLASNAPVMVAPAMNVTMWNHPATQRSIAQLKADGVHFVAPVAGELACKTVGTGKLEDAENIAAQALELLNSRFQIPDSRLEEEIPDSNFQISNLGNQKQDSNSSANETNLESGIWNLESTTNLESNPNLKSHSSNLESGIWNLESKDLLGERILITVGGTREAIDPVRFISNHSSGKMGFAVAEKAAARGAEVVVVCGVTSVEPPESVKVVKAVSAQEMYDAVMNELPQATVFIGAAAVADYRPKRIAEVKIKKTVNDIFTLELEKTPDILANVSKNRHQNLLVVGFAAETNDVINYARSKMEKKNLDLVVANDITQKGAGFGSDTNIASIITRAAETNLPLMSKLELADRILDKIVELKNR